MNTNVPKKSRKTMNGKPVISVPVKTVLNLKSAFKFKLLCDGPTLALGDACAYSCSFCYVPSVYQKLDRIGIALRELSRERGREYSHEDVVIRREGATDVLLQQLLHANGKPKYCDPADNRVVYASPADDVAANMDLVRATVEACKSILTYTNWSIRLLSKSNLLLRIPEMLVNFGFSEERVKRRMIFGFSTGTLDDALAKAIEEGTPRVSKRIEALHELQDKGYRTFAMVCPSLPMADYGEFASKAQAALRYDRCEHVWAEVINLRGASFTRTIDRLHKAGLQDEATRLAAVSRDKEEWEKYNRDTFLAHADACPAGKLRYLTYVNDKTREWWAGHEKDGAVILHSSTSSKDSS